MEGTVLLADDDHAIRTVLRGEVGNDELDSEA